MAGYIGNKAVALSTTAANVTGTITAGALDISGDTDVDGTTNLDVTNIVGDLTVTGDTITFTSANANDPAFKLINTTNDTDGAELQIRKDKGAAGADGDIVGLISFIGDDATQQQHIFAKMEASIATAADGSEGGKLAFGVASHDAEFQNGLVLQDGNAEDEIDVTIGNGTSSLTTIAGTLTSTGAITSNAGVVVDNITIDGTEIDLSSGTLTLDSAGDISLQAGSGGERLLISNSTGDVILRTADRFIYSNGSSGGTTIDAGIRFESATPKLEFWVNDGERASISSDGTATFGNTGGNATAIIQGSSGAGSTNQPGSDLQLKGGAGGGTGGSNIKFFTAPGGSSGTSESAAVERMRIKSNGTIMSVDAGTDNTRFGEDAGAALVSGANSNVLIGDVAGTSLTSPASFNVAVGHLALDADTKGDNTVAVGYAALSNQNFSEASTDSGNTAVGYLAGVGNVTGINNTFIGDRAGDAITGSGYSGSTRQAGGDNNVAVGQGALTGDTKGNRSTALGYQTLVNQNFSSSTDSHNTAVGAFAGTAIQSGRFNTLVGSSAATTLAGGQQNVAIGYQALTNADEDDENVAIGSNALFAQNAGDATNNVGVGCDVGVNLSTATSTTLVGTDANGSGVMTGGANTAVGTEALFSCTSGEGNAIMGYQAARALTVGSYNVAIGREALESDDVGSRCVAIGYRSLRTQDSAGATANSMYNTAVGYEAGTSIDTGYYNTFVGGLAGDGTDDGQENVAVGYQALSGNCGNSNVAVGVQAGIAVTGATNTLIGNGAGSGLGNGSENVFIGDAAGTRGTDAATTGSCILIGHDTGTSASDSTSQILLGVDTQATTDNSFHVGIGSSLISIPINGSTTTFSASSDERLKENIATSTAGLSFLKDLRPVTYTWKKKKDVPSNMPYFYEEGSDDPCVGEGKTYHGFVAQEIKTALDNHTEIKDGQDLWHEDDHGTQRVAPGALVPILVKALQELSAKNDALEARIATLEGS